MDENKDPLLSPPNHHPVVIKVKKTSADSWHIEQQGTNESTSLNDGNTDANSVMTKRNGKSLEHNDIANISPCRIGNSPQQSQAKYSHNAILLRMGTRSIEVMSSGGNVPSTACNNKWMRIPPQVGRTGDDIGQKDNISDVANALSCRQCGFSACSIIDFMGHVKKTHYRQPVKHKLHINDLSRSASHMENCDLSKQEKRIRLDSVELQSAPAEQNTPPIASTSMKCQKVADIPNGTVDTVLPVASAKSSSGNIEVDDAGSSQLQTKVVKLNDDKCDSQDRKAKPHNEPPIGRVSPFVKYEKRTEGDCMLGQDTSLAPPPLEQLGISELSSMLTTETADEQPPYLHSGASNSSSSCGSIKDQKTKSRGAKLDSIVNSLKENTSAVPKPIKNDDNAEEKCHSNEIAGSATYVAGFNSHPVSARPCGSRFPTPTGISGSCAMTNNYPVPGEGNFFPSHPACCGTTFSNSTAHVQAPCIPESSPQSAGMCGTHGHMPFSRPGYNTQRFQDLQSLLASGCVTMPDNKTLQSINCSQDRWNVIQETLHEAFSIFPYLTWQESQSLARNTGLSVKQVKALFVVARLQHGISWEQDEIDNARRSLVTRSKNRFSSSCQMSNFDNAPQHRSIFPGLPPLTKLQCGVPHLTPEQCDILRWSYTTIALSENELNRLVDVTKLPQPAILQYFKQLQSEIGPALKNPPARRRRSGLNFGQANMSGAPSRSTGGEDTTWESLEKLKRSTNHANKYFETSRFVLGRDRHFVQSSMLNNANKR